MAKLYFKYSTMNAGKSIDLIRTNFNYLENNKKTLCFTSSRDDRYGVGKIASRIGLSTDAIPIYNNTNVFEIVKNENDISCVFVDEVQFLKKEHIFQLSDIVDILNIPVICYGLRSDFKVGVFEGSKYLMAIADNIEEIKTICTECKCKKAIINAKIIDGKIVSEGSQIQIGGNETYKPLCRKCYKTILNDNQ
jgi:thymidine kinase